MLTEDEKKARIGLITSSVAAACLGKDPDMSPIDAWEKILGIGEPFDGNAATHRGNHLERLVLEHGMTAVGADCMGVPGFMQHKDMPWAGDSCDALYFDASENLIAVGEGKTVALGSLGNWGEPGTDQVPDKVLIQSCWHLLHYPDAPVCVVPMLAGGYDFSFRNYIIERNGEWLGILRDDLHKFWRDYVQPQKRPPVTAADTEWLKRRWPRGDKDKVIDATPALDKLARYILEKKAQLAEIEGQVDGACNVLRDWLEDATCVKGVDWTVTYRNDKDGEALDRQALVALALSLGATQEQIEQCIISRPGPRKLRVVPLKAKEKAA